MAANPTNNNIMFSKKMLEPNYKPSAIRVWAFNQWHTFRLIFLYGDTVTIRALLMVASAMQTVGFWLPLGTLERPAYVNMTIAPGWLWGALFLAHAAAQWWRFRSGPNRLMGFIVNLYGFVLWTFTTLLGTFAIGAYSPTSALEWTTIVALFATLVRTGDPSDRMSP